VLRTSTLHARNRLAETILAALHDVDARHELAALAGGHAHGDVGGDDAADADTLRTRAQAAERAVAGVPLARAGDALDVALDDAAALFDAGLFFEVHEVLEPLWQDAGTGRADAAPGAAREPLQGLIQIAVGYQHGANGNVRGARALLVDGTERIAGRVLAGRELDAFAAAVRASLAGIDDLDGTTIPKFPRVSDVEGRRRSDRDDRPT
jgi:predicted metal-dependent hydrolase